MDAARSMAQRMPMFTGRRLHFGLRAGGKLTLVALTVAGVLTASGMGWARPSGRADPTTQPGAAAEVKPEWQPAPNDPEAKLQPPARPMAPGEASNAGDVRRLYWLGFYHDAQTAYERLLAAGPVEASEQAALTIGLAEVDVAVGQYAEALERTAALKQELVGALDADLHRRLVHARWQALIATGLYDDALRWAQSAEKVREDLAFDFLIGQSLVELNRSAEAVAALQPVFDTFKQRTPKNTSERLWGGQALYLFFRERGTLRSRLIQPVLHDYFQRAYEKDDRELWPARLAAARMLQLHYQTDQATGDAIAALQVNPNLADAYALLAEIDLENWNFERIERRTGRALSINPRHADALLVAAQGKMLERRFDDAIRLAERVLQTNPKHPVALALRVGALYRKYDDQHAAKRLAEVEAQWPNDWRVYLTIADALAGGRQYQPAEKYFRKALAVAPKRPEVLTSFGLMLMQTGDDAEARKVLEESFNIDGYNRVTFNYLGLLDYVQGRGQASFSSKEGEHFILKFDAEQDHIVGDHFLAYLDGIYDELAELYDWQLDRKTVIEVYPTAQKFSVRITGEPWIPTVGASTGPLIAMTSPRRSAGAAPYNWPLVLKHEYTHTVTLGATHNRIPHWFTEGLAVANEDTKRPWEWCLLLQDAYRRGELFTLDSIDWGFQRPRKVTDRTMAYAQSEWMVEFLVQRFGFDRINELLSAFRAGKSLQQAWLDVLKVPTSKFDDEFRLWAGQQIKSWGLPNDPVEQVDVLLDQIDDQRPDAELLARLAQAQFDAGQLEESLTSAKNSVEIKPTPRGLALAAQLSLGKSRTRDELVREVALGQARKFAKQLAELDPTHPMAPLVLATLATDAEELADAEQQWRRYKHLMPLDPLSYRRLAGIYLTADDADKALPELISLCELDVNDHRLPRRVAQIYAARADWQRAVDWQRRSLNIDLHSAEAHYDLGQWLEKLNRPADAAKAYADAALLEPNNSTYTQARDRLKTSAP